MVDSEVQLLLGGGVKTLVTVGDTWTCVYMGPHMLTWQTYANTLLTSASFFVLKGRQQLFSMFFRKVWLLAKLS